MVKAHLLGTVGIAAVIGGIARVARLLQGRDRGLSN